MLHQITKIYNSVLDNNVLISYLNINSPSYKVIDLRKLLPNFYHITLHLQQQKPDEAFPNLQFTFDQYEIWTPRSRNKKVMGLIEYARKDLICKSLENTINQWKNSKISKVTIKSNERAMLSVYRSPRNSNIDRFLGDLSLLLNKYHCKYDKIMVGHGWL